MSHFDLLKSCPIFSQLSDSEMILLEKSCEEILLAKGEDLYKQGDMSKGFCLIKAGKLSAGDDDGVLNAGDFIGSFSLYKSGLKAKLDVQAIETTALLCLSQQKFYALGQDNPHIQLKVAYGILNEYVSELDQVAEILLK
ncbi:MAG TPA: Crp/Fnr family transcriptional regulator [Oligoflexia bacterium]|nr:Crp/Fnr family transcriptional regulator [Oligoflexia bacterium]HMR23709.1 Crp/Fnr family transcriptional regulator [Oligoflexia bacterium]